MAVVVCMTIDPRIPTMPGRSLIGFAPTRQTSLACAKREAKHEAFGESHEKGELHPTKNRPAP